MSYIAYKFDNGEVTMRDLVCGWFFPETNEFRPLMQDAMDELLRTNRVTLAHVGATEIARDAHIAEVLTSYVKSEEGFWSNPEHINEQNERLAEMQSAFGEGAEVVNALTGRKHTL
jgi:hypothetical protein